MKGRREEGEMKGGRLQSSECQVLMCLFSITAVPGSDREGKQTATLMYYTQPRNSGLVAISLRRNVSPPSPLTSQLHALVFVETEQLRVAHLFSCRKNETRCVSRVWAHLRHRTNGTGRRCCNVHSLAVAPIQKR